MCLTSLHPALLVHTQRECLNSRLSGTTLPVRTYIIMASRYAKAYWVRDGVGTRIS
jgi:hypothetical protein